jgi:hypothetical protein
MTENYELVYRRRQTTKRGYRKVFVQLQVADVPWSHSYSREGALGYAKTYAQAADVESGYSCGFNHITRTIGKWIACFYREYTVPSQAVLHAAKYITTPENPAQTAPTSTSTVPPIRLQANLVRWKTS